MYLPAIFCLESKRVLGKFVEQGMRPVAQNGRGKSVGFFVVLVQMGRERFF